VSLVHRATRIVFGLMCAALISTCGRTLLEVSVTVLQSEIQSRSGVSKLNDGRHESVVSSKREGCVGTGFSSGCEFHSERARQTKPHSKFCDKDTGSAQPTQRTGT